MKLVRPIRIRLGGDEHRAQDYIGLGRTLLGALRERLALGANLGLGVDRKQLSDGTLIVCEAHAAEDRLTIHVPVLPRGVVPTEEPVLPVGPEEPFVEIQLWTDPFFGNVTGGWPDYPVVWHFMRLIEPGGLYEAALHEEVDSDVPMAEQLFCPQSTLYYRVGGYHYDGFDTDMYVPYLPSGLLSVRSDNLYGGFFSDLHWRASECAALFESLQGVGTAEWEATNRPKGLSEEALLEQLGLFDLRYAFVKPHLTGVYSIKVARNALLYWNPENKNYATVVVKFGRGGTTRVFRFDLPLIPMYSPLGVEFKAFSCIAQEDWSSQHFWQGTLFVDPLNALAWAEGPLRSGP